MCARILVVDDVEANRKSLESKLEGQYFDVALAKSGIESLQMLQEEEFDIILIDSLMPEMDGFETCRRIKADKKTANIPVIILTSMGWQDDRSNFLDAGADDLISKPILDSSLFSRIKSLVRLKRMMDELISKSKGVIDPNSLYDAKLNEEIASSKILIIDDDLNQILNLKSAIETISENIVVIKDFPFDIKTDLDPSLDLIIVSTQLIEEDGLRICSKIINSPRLKKIPILIVAEEGDENTIVKALDMQVVDYLVAPIESTEVNIRILSQLKRKKLLDKLKKSLEKSLNLARTDSLTGLYNRHYFENHARNLLDNAISAQKPLALMVLDIDYFKSVNDTYGHLVGDEILEEVAKRIKDNSRDIDIVCRFGGEEFVILLPEMDLANAKASAEKIRLAIQDSPFQISHESGFVSKTISIGIAELSGSEGVESLIARADKGLYIAKEHGRNIVITVKDVASS